MSASKTSNPAPIELTVEEINILYQLAKQASIRVTEVGKVHSVITRVEQYLSANLK